VAPLGGLHPGQHFSVQKLECVASDHTHLLTGFMGEACFLRAVIDFVRQQKAVRPDQSKLCWVCDPVMGDNGRYYVSEEVVKVYQNEVLPFVQIITPNHFELKWLCGEVSVDHFENANEVLVAPLLSNASITCCTDG